jgi:serine/threonine-protein kinase
MMELSIKHRYKNAQEVLNALDLAPYEEGMRQNMVSGFLKSPTPIPVAEPTTHLNTNLSKRLGRNDPATAAPRSSPVISIAIRREEADPQTALETGNLASPSSTAPQGGSPAGQIGYNIAAAGQVAGRDRKRGSEPSQALKPIKYTAKALVAAYEQGRRDFAQQDLMDLQLSKVIFPNIICYQAKLTRTNLQGSDLTKGDFGRASLEGANLKNANLYSAYLSYADLTGADLRGADLTGADFKYANLRGANFCGANLTNANVTEDQIVMAKVNWMTIMPSGKRGFW